MRLLAFGGYLLIIGCATTTRIPVPGAADLAAVRAIEARRLGSAVAADVAALRPLLSEQLVYCHSTGHCESGTSLLARIGSGDLKYLKITPEEMQAEPLAGAVLLRGSLSAEVLNAGQSLSLQLRYLAVYEQTAGHWQLRAYQSTRMP